MDFGETLHRLLLAYASEAWPFALMHLVVLGFIFHALYRLSRERDALLAFHSAAKPRPITPAEDSMATTLAQFEREAAKLSAQGMILPMTDYSDRLDASFQEKTGHVMDLINLLLIIGIAGTMFGVFEFAYGASATAGTVDLAGLLTTSMAHAFPVGFIGLALMFVFQFVASRFQHRLQEAVTLATQKALSHRSEAASTQAQIIRDAAEAISTGLKPLENLQATLTESLSPVVMGFKDQLKEAVGVIQQQHASLAGTTIEMENGAKAIRDSINALRVETEGIKDLLDRTPVVLNNITELQDQQRVLLEAFAIRTDELGTHVQRSANLIENTAGLLARLPGDLLGVMEHTSGQIREQAGTHLEAMADGLGRTLETRLHSFTEDVKAAAIEAGESIRTASNTLHGYAENAESLLNNRFMDAVSKALNLAQEQIDQVLLARYPDAIKSVEDLSNHLEEFLTHLNNILHEQRTAQNQFQGETITSLHDLHMHIIQAISSLKNEIHEQEIELVEAISASTIRMQGDLQHTASTFDVTLQNAQQTKTALTATTEDLLTTLYQLRNGHRSTRTIRSRIKRWWSSLFSQRER